MLKISKNSVLQDELQHYLWNCVQKPQVTTKLILTDEGLMVHFAVHEQNPLITATEQQEPMLMVCQDSAVEVFLAFADKIYDEQFQPQLEHCFYTNIEINAKGICYAKYGRSRKNRTAFTQEEIKALKIRTEILHDYWTCDLVIPRELINKLIGFDGFAENNRFFINLYKISETKDIEHYVALNKIENATPNFHLPEFFAEAKVVS